MSHASEKQGESAAIVPSGSSERFVCRLSDGEFFWSYYDERGRLLVSGPPHGDQWEAHRRLLGAIQDEATSGSLLSATEEPQDDPREESHDQRHADVAQDPPSPAAPRCETLLRA